MNPNENQTGNKRLETKLREMASHISAIWEIRDNHFIGGSERAVLSSKTTDLSAGNAKVNPILRLLSNLFRRS
jgi:hypothetical protein